MKRFRILDLGFWIKRNPLSRFQHFKIPVQGLMLVAFGMSMGCAIGLPGANSQYTRLTFTITMNAPIPSPSSLTDPGNYQYYVVMALYTGAAQPSPTSIQQIAPVITTGSGGANAVNGIFTGQATNVVALNLTSGGNPDVIYDLATTPTEWGGFPLGTPAGYTNDQLPPLDGNNNYPATWTFTVFTNQLQAATVAQTYTWITFQVISMNSPAGTSGRYMDALGNSPAAAFDETLPVQISTSATYNFTQLQQVPQVVGTYPSGGDPALAIQNVTLQVSPP